MNLFHNKAAWAIAGVCLASALATSLSAATSEAATRPQSSPPPACATSALVVWLNTNGDGAAGSTYFELEFTNLASRSCTLYGFPGVSGVNLADHQIGSPASRDPAQPTKLVTLAPGSTAKATLRIVEAGNFPQARCGQAKAAGLRIYPPNQTSSRIVPFPFAACSKEGVTYLSIGAVTQ